MLFIVPLCAVWEGADGAAELGRDQPGVGVDAGEEAVNLVVTSLECDKVL